ncbi:hypothetical protein Trco_003208 [Trichoderma cornu-damae]|uniref:Uncharacterized protein n=1 Tax=Trichoderma cornu-damae TaxID=654480 RepID=A0A9P8TZB0_9HYPO|nr:hypothetical protein Trco_003208 [Trichoderma cornu-damae]
MQLLAAGNVADGKQGQVVDVLVGVVAHAGKDAQVRLARVVDEARRAGEELAVHLQRRALEARVERLRVGELVEGEEVDVLALGDGGGGAAAVGLGGGDDLAEVAVDELAPFDGHLGVDSSRMALVQRLLGVEHLGPQQARLDAMRVVGVGFPAPPPFLHGPPSVGALDLAAVVVVIVVVVAAAALLIRQVGEAEASHVLAIAVALAGASAAETILSRLDALAQDHAVYEAEVGGDDGLVFGVDDGDGHVLVDGKGA